MDHSPDPPGQKCQSKKSQGPGINGRDKKDPGLKPAQANISATPYLEKNPLQKRAGGVAQGVGSEFNPPPILPKKKRTGECC
jgi:hypothetical protein